MRGEKLTERKEKQAYIKHKSKFIKAFNLWSDEIK